MFRRSSSTSGLWVAMMLSASLTVQSFPLTRSRVVFNVRANLNQPSSSQEPSARTTDAQQKSAPKTDSQTGPVPAAVGPVITATLRDTGWPNFPGPATAGVDTITYTAIITNTGTADATGVTFNDIINPNYATLVGTPTLSSVLVGDLYTSLGNVGINSANLTGCPTANTCHSVTDNDSVTGGEALSKFAASQATLTGGGGTVINGSNTVTTANSGTVLMNTDGTFTYNPAAGFSGTDSFFYAVNGSTGIATAQVTITVTTPIWFIDAAAGGTHVGTLANPFNCLTGGAGCFSNVNDNAAGHPKDNDNVFMYSGAYTGGLTPRNGQKLIGQGASASLGSIAGVTVPTESNTLPSTGGVNPTVTTVAASTNGINLGVGFSNTLRGFTIGNTTGAKIASGASFGTLTVGNNTTPDMTLNGTGQALNLTSGTFAATSKFSSVTTTSSTTSGLTLTSVAGTVAFGSTTISGNNNECLITFNSTADINYGNTSCTGGGNGVTFSGNTSGTRTFGTLSVSGGSGNSFSHSGGGGNVTVSGAANLSSAAPDTIVIQNAASGNLINFAGGATVTHTGTGGNGVQWSGTNTGATLTFESLAVTTSNGTGINLAGGGTVNVTNNSKAVSATGIGAQTAPAILANGVALNANFSSVSCNGSGTGGNCISLTTVTGTSILGGGTLSGAAGATFLVSGGTTSVTYAGGITQANNAAAVSVAGGHNTGTITFNTGTISATNGTGLQFDNADGIYNFNGTNTLNGGDAGIDILNASAGTFSFSSNTSITSPSGTAFNVASSSANVTYNGTITQANAQRAINIASETGGTIAFTGAVSSTSGTGTGINLVTNSGATINFTGGITLTTNANDAFTATGGGVVNISGTNNITATSGKGINWSADTSSTGVTFNNVTSTTGATVTIASSGASDFTFNDVASGAGKAVSITTATGDFIFHAISANGGTTGIDVTSATGSFTVNGTSTTGGTGGTIQNTSNSGVKFTSSNNITLKNMNLTNNATTQGSTAASCGNNLVAGDTTTCTSNLFLNSVTTITINNLSITGSTQQGISGTSVSAMTLTGTTISGNGNEDFEDGFIFKNLTGTSTITNTTIQNNFSRQGHIYNSAGTLTLNVTGSFFGRTVAPLVSSQQGLLMQLANTSVSNVDIGTSSFNKNGNGNGLAITVTDTASLGSSGSHSSVHNSPSMTENAAHVFMSTGGSGTAFFDVMNNSVMTKAGLQGIDYFVGTNSTASGQITGVIQGNTIGTSGVASSACSAVGQGCDGMTLDKDGAGALSLRIQSNTIQQVNTNGIALNTTVSNALNASIISNTIREPAGGANQGNAMLFNVGANSGSTTTACYNVGGAGVQNTINSTSSWDINGSGSAIFFNTKNATVTRQPGYGGTTTDDVAFASFTTGRNTFTGVGASPATFSQRFNGSTYGGGGACTVPLLFAAGGVESLLHAPSLLSTFALSPATAPIAGTRCGTSVANTATLSTPSLVSASLDQKQLDAITAAAVDRWISTGLTPGQVAILRGIKFVVADLGGDYLGEASGDRILVDRNASGKGWYTGADSSSDALFSRSVSATRRYTDPMNAPAGHIDLLTAIEHEMGHRLGLIDTYVERDRDNLMYGYLTVGERRLPAQGQARLARASIIKGVHFLRVGERTDAVHHKAIRKVAPAQAPKPRTSDNKVTPAAGGTVSFGPFGLSIGSSVTIIFQVTINAATPLPHVVSNQGTVAGTNFFLVNGVSTANPNTDDPDTGAAADPTLTPLVTPTAATSTVTGRIADDNGNPVEGAVIRLNGTQDRKTITDSHGNYAFSDVETNGFYTVTPSRVNYNFAPATRGFSALGAHTEASFGATTNGNHQNPLDTTEYFVRQQYVDFLGREPEEKGFNDWTDTINNCASGDASCDRIHVSEMFFRSEEFQQRGYFVYRFYSTALGRKPDFAEFTPDMARVSGFLTSDQLEAAKTAFANDFVNRPAFAPYATMTNAQYVDALSQTAGVTLSNRQALVDGLEHGTLTRAQALRQIAESGEVYARYYNQAFVVMEYFGYLKRDPDILYLNWISVLDANPADSRHMVEGFVDATEYRNRFKQ